MDKLKDSVIKIESRGYLNGVLVQHKVEELMSKWISKAVCDEFSNNMGIGFINPIYIEVNEIQDRIDEYNKILRFLKKYLEHYAQKNNMSVNELTLDFINYGKTELVYVLTDKNGKRLTLLVKQPAVKFGDIYQEMQYLLELKERDIHVVAPIDYFQLGNQELYVTRYINQARCIASDGRWGVYIPEPFYRFQVFTKEQESVVNICMISKLVSLYDFDKQEGVSFCKLGGGDFMLSKGWELEPLTIENTLNQLYLIAARNKIKCSFEEYLQIIREEFSRVTITEDQSQLIINLRGRAAMNSVDIDRGINLGKSFIEYQDNSSLVKRLDNSSQN